MIVARRLAAGYGRAYNVSDAADAAFRIRETEVSKVKDFMLMVEEKIRQRMPGGRQMVRLVDVTTEAKPWWRLDLDGAGGQREFLRAAADASARIPRI